MVAWNRSAMTTGHENDLPRELERAGALCVAFANTQVPRPDQRFDAPDEGPAYRFVDYGELLGWAQRMGILTAAEGELLGREAAGRPQEAAAALARVRGLRDALMSLFTALAFGREPRQKDLDTLNTALGVQRVVSGAHLLDFHRQPGGEPMDLDRVLAGVAHSAAELLSSEELKRLRQCGAEGCRRLFVHRSKRRLWCDMNTCGSRLKARRRSRR